MRPFLCLSGMSVVVFIYIYIYPFVKGIILQDKERIDVMGRNIWWREVVIEIMLNNHL